MRGVGVFLFHQHSVGFDIQTQRILVRFGEFTLRDMQGVNDDDAEPPPAPVAA